MRVLSAVLALLLVCTIVSFGQTSTEPQQPSSAPAPQTPPSDQKPAAQRVRVSPGVSQGLLIHKVSPQYPREARANGIQGTVVLEALIGKDGLVKEVKKVSGPEELAQASIAAVQQWQYRPYTLNGQPVEVETKINVIFTLARF
jgi:protein TonB